MSLLPPFPNTSSDIRDRSTRAVPTHVLLFGALVALLAVVAGIGVLVSVWQALWLSVSFEPSDTARFQASVGESLRTPALAAFALLAAAVFLARPWRLRGSVALALSLTAVMGSVTVTGVALRSAEMRLHPSLGRERTAIRAFSPSPNAGVAYTTSAILSHPEITVVWTIEGSEATICTNAIAAFNTWTNPGTAHTPSRRLLPNDRVGQRGPDQARLSCIAPPKTHTPVSVTLQLTRA
jgi:hypothetical protein